MPPVYAAAIEGAPGLSQRLEALMPGTTFCNGFLAGEAGASPIPEAGDLLKQSNPAQSP